MSRHFLWIVTFVLLACGDTTESQPERDGASDDAPLPGTSRRIGDVGQGFDTINRTIKSMYCIQPAAGSSWPEVGYASSKVSMALESDRSKIARSLGLDVEVSYGIASAAASFFRETESDDLSVSYVFGGTMNFKDVQVGGNYQVNPHLRDVGVVEWHRLCGDSYVHSITRGASLYAALRFHFSSRSEKEQFQTKFKVTGGLSASAALKSAESISKESVGVTVMAVQVGGDVTQLSRALSGVEAESCSLGDTKQCMGYLQAIEDYATKTFPSQFLDAAGRPLTGAALDMVTATTGYVSKPWSTLAISQLPDLSDKPHAKKILSHYLKQYGTQEKIDAINAIPILLRRSEETADLQRSVLEQDSLTISENLSSLNQAWDACFPNVTPDCAKAIEDAEASLVEIEADHLVPWYDMLYPDGEPGDPRDLVDVNGDGVDDLCYGVERGVHCLMGVGLGFEEMPRPWVADHGYTPLRDKPWAWVDLGGEELGMAFCAPYAVGLPQLQCMPVIDGTLGRFAMIVWREAWDDVEVRTQLTEEVDWRAAYIKAAEIINDRWDGIWFAAFP